MIVVRVELHSAIDGSKTELARMHICNVNGNRQWADYEATTFRGRCAEALSKLVPRRHSEVKHHAKARLHVWNLVGKALRNMGYGLD